MLAPKSTPLCLSNMVSVQEVVRGLAPQAGMRKSCRRASRDGAKPPPDHTSPKNGGASHHKRPRALARPWLESASPQRPRSSPLRGAPKRKPVEPWTATRVGGTSWAPAHPAARSKSGAERPLRPSLGPYPGRPCSSTGPDFVSHRTLRLPTDFAVAPVVMSGSSVCVSAHQHFRQDAPRELLTVDVVDGAPDARHGPRPVILTMVMHSCRPWWCRFQTDAGCIGGPGCRPSWQPHQQDRCFVARYSHRFDCVLNFA